MTEPVYIIQDVRGEMPEGRCRYCGRLFAEWKTPCPIGRSHLISDEWLAWAKLWHYLHVREVAKAEGWDAPEMILDTDQARHLAAVVKGYPLDQRPALIAEAMPPRRLRRLVDFAARS